MIAQKHYESNRIFNILLSSFFGFISSMGRSRGKYCFLVCPLAEIGGGMGQMVLYLLDSGQKHLPLRLLPVDPRGRGSVLLSPAYLAAAVVRIAIGAATGRLALVHLNVADRASIFRKASIAYVAGWLGVPVLVHLHAAEIRPFYERLPGVGRRFVRGMFLRADLCVVLGAVWQHWLQARLGVLESRIVVLRNGVPRVTSVSSPRTAPVSNVRAFNILFLGNLMPRKGVGELLRALVDPVLADCSFEAIFVGGGDVQTYRRQAAMLGLGAKARFTGWVDQAAARALTARADVLVLPSYDEGLPLVILQALSAGTPVICTPVGSIPETLRDGSNALFVRPGEPGEIALALRRLIDDPILSERLAAAGRALYEAEFTMEAFADRLAALYRRITVAA